MNVIYLGLLKLMKNIKLIRTVLNGQYYYSKWKRI